MPAAMVGELGAVDSISAVYGGPKDQRLLAEGHADKAQYRLLTEDHAAKAHYTWLQMGDSLQQVPVW